MQPKMGRPFTYDSNIHLQPLIEAVDSVVALGQVAGLCGIPRSTFFDWLKKGDIDLKNNKNSDFAQLSDAIRRAQAEKAKKLITEAMEGKPNVKFIQWLLKVCLRDDFGEDSELYKELLAAYMKLADDMKRIRENPLQGLVSDGKKMDSESD